MTVDFAPVPSVPLSTLYPFSFSPPMHASSPPTRQTSEEFKPSPLTGGALHLGPTDSMPSDSSSQDSFPPTPPEWHVRLDTGPTLPSSFTLLKTTHRTCYNASRSRALPTHPTPGAQIYTDVILYNSVDELTEGTTTSLYFFRGGRWVIPPVGVPAGGFTSDILQGSEEAGDGGDEGELRTPFAGRWGHSVRSAKVGAGGQRGTSRRWALKKGFCMEETVDKRTIKVGEGVWVSNGVRGFGFGTVVG